MKLRTVLAGIFLMVFVVIMLWLRPAGEPDEGLAREAQGAGLVKVTVVGETDGEPIANARVELNMAITEQTDLEGRCLFEGIPEGPCWVSITAPGYRDFMEKITVSHQEPEAYVFGLKQSAGLSLKIVLADGRHPDKVFVQVHGSRVRRVASAKRTREDGVVDVPNLSKGSYDLEVVHYDNDQLHIAFLKGVAVPGDLVPVQLQRAASLEVRVPALDPNQEGVEMLVLDEDGAPIPRFASWENGAFSTNLSPGLWDLKVQAPDGRTWSGQVNLKPGTVEVVTL